MEAQYTSSEMPSNGSGLSKSPTRGSMPGGTAERWRVGRTSTTGLRWHNLDVT
jgi:hypothetical protein